MPEQNLELIDRFDGEYFFLSNFYPSWVNYEGQSFPNVEAAFQAAKTLDKTERAQFRELLPGAAKRLGRKLQLRPDWEQVKIGVMAEILADKFSEKTRVLRQRLIETGDAQLIEGNNWHDNIWGDCKCIEIGQADTKPQCAESGRNLLGQLLMELRAKITPAIAA